MVDAYPLQWPEGWERTETRQYSRFETSFANARDGLIHEIHLLGGKFPIISTNIPIRRDGLPYAKFRTPDDPGVAVYFDLDGQQQCFPCDRWTRIQDNLHAVELCISALRGLERWGAKEMVRASFRGFEALPYNPDNEDTLKPEKDYFADCNTIDQINDRFRSLSKVLHPDVKGDGEEFTIMMKQLEKKKAELK